MTQHISLNRFDHICDIWNVYCELQSVPPSDALLRALSTHCMACTPWCILSRVYFSSRLTGCCFMQLYTFYIHGIACVIFKTNFFLEIYDYHFGEENRCYLINESFATEYFFWRSHLSLNWSACAYLKTPPFQKWDSAILNAEMFGTSRHCSWLSEPSGCT